MTTRCRITSAELTDRVAAILNAAQRAGYKLEQEQAGIGLLIFRKGAVQVNVYATTMTVATCMHHPKRGRTQLFRRRVGMRLLAQIFAKPRVHTGRGYYEA